MEPTTVHRLPTVVHKENENSNVSLFVVIPYLYSVLKLFSLIFVSQLLWEDNAETILTYFSNLHNLKP